MRVGCNSLNDGPSGDWYESPVEVLVARGMLLANAGLNNNQFRSPTDNQLTFSEGRRKFYFLLWTLLRNSAEVVNSTPSLGYSALPQSVGLVERPSAARRCCQALLQAPFLLDGSEISALR